MEVRGRKIDESIVEMLFGVGIIIYLLHLAKVHSILEVIAHLLWMKYGTCPHDIELGVWCGGCVTKEKERVILECVTRTCQEINKRT